MSQGWVDPGKFQTTLWSWLWCFVVSDKGLENSRFTKHCLHIWHVPKFHIINSLDSKQFLITKCEVIRYCLAHILPVFITVFLLYKQFVVLCSALGGPFSSAFHCEATSAAKVFRHKNLKVFIFVSPKCTFLSVSESHEALEFGDIWSFLVLIFFVFASCHNYSYQGILYFTCITEYREHHASVVAHHWTRASQLYSISCCILTLWHFLNSLCMFLVVGWLNLITLSCPISSALPYDRLYLGIGLTTLVVMNSWVLVC